MSEYHISRRGLINRLIVLRRSLEADRANRVCSSELSVVYWHPGHGSHTVTILIILVTCTSLQWTSLIIAILTRALMYQSADFVSHTFIDSVGSVAYRQVFKASGLQSTTTTKGMVSTWLCKRGITVLYIRVATQTR
jgi:hypothetical protein